MIIGKSTIAGLYLPLLWPEENIIKSPLVLGQRSDFIPLIPHNPASGRDFIPLENANGDRMPLRSLHNKEKVQSDDLVNSYLDVQQQSVLVNGQLVNLQLAKLNILEMPYDSCIIEQYLDEISSTHVDLETYILADRWSQLAIGFPPMDWFLPKQVSLYAFSCSQPAGEQHQDYDTPEEAQTTVLSASGNESFFKRKTIERSTKGKEEEPKKPDIKAKRAVFKRTAALSDMGPGFGGRRGAMIGGDMDESSGPVRKAGPIAARPGLGNRMRPRKKTFGVDMISEESAISENPLEQKLKSAYHAPEVSTDEPRGFVVDRSALRAKQKFTRKGSLSDFISPC